jgi:hypothetical protein
MAVAVVMSALTGCWLGLPCSRPELSKLHPGREVG